MPLRDFQHVRDWVFDLDHTLYPAQSQLFSQLEKNMEHYLMRELRVSKSEAFRLRRAYWKSHGTTLAGMMFHHNTNPHAFLDEVQAIDFSVLQPNPALRNAISSLPGRKIVFTNGSRTYAQSATDALGLNGVFEAHYGIDDAEFVCKPAAQAFDTVFAKAKVKDEKAAMFEDDPRNLKTPHQRGLKTVLVGSRHKAEHVHHQTDDLVAFLTRISGSPNAY